MKIKLMHPNAQIPTLGTPDSAGYDLYACIDQPRKLPKGSLTKIGTGVAVQPDDARIAGFIYSRSGMTQKKGIVVANGVGVIDSDYRGEIQVLLINTSQMDQEILPGERIAQIVFQSIEKPALQVVSSLVDTLRGTGGFGSTGEN